MYNRTTITQLGICKVKIEHNNKDKIYNFFVFPRNGQTLLGMPDINKTKHYNYKLQETEEADRANKYSTITANCHGSRCEQHYMNMMQEAERPQKCYTKTYSISKSNNKDRLMAPDNENSKINYFLLGLNQDNVKKMSAEITQQLQRDFKDVLPGTGCFDGTFSLQVKQDSKPYQASSRCMAYTF